MSPSLVPRTRLVSAALISVLALIAAKPPLISARSRRDMPAGLPNTVLASSAEDERPAKPVPILLTLCSLMAKPFAISWQEAVATATASVGLNQACLIIWVLLKKYRDAETSRKKNDQLRSSLARSLQ